MKSALPPNSAPRRNFARVLRVFVNWRLSLYNFAIIAFAPFFLVRKLRRFFFKKTSYEFARARWEIPVYGGQNDDANALHVVFMSIGLGEQHATEQLDAALKKVRPNLRTTWAAKAQDAVENIRSTHPHQAVTFIPFDFSPSVARWLCKLQPDVVVSVEKLWIPNIVWGAKLWGAPVVIVSGRAGRFAGHGLKGALWRNINRWTLRACEIVCLQSEAEKNWIAHVLPPAADLRITGTIKAGGNSEVKPNSQALRTWIEAHNSARAPIFAAGSTTHREEEEWVLDAFDEARQSAPCALLLAPRRLHRVDEVLELLRERGLNVVRKSEFSIEDSRAASTHDHAQADVFLLDTMGELAAAYEFCIAAFVGGTLQGQGHNIMEPLEWGVPVFFGPGKGPTAATQMLAQNAGAGFRVTSALELGEGWQRILQDSSWRETLCARCGEVIAQEQRGLEANLAAIVEIVDRVEITNRVAREK